MFTADNILKWVTLLGAVIAAVSSSWNLWVKFHENKDKIKVGFGPLRPPHAPGYWLHVTSQSSHAMYLKDYGFIDESGKLLSLLQLQADEPYEDIDFRGKCYFDQRGDLFEIGPCQLRDKQIGAFAITTTQKRHIIEFENDVPFCQRLKIKFKIWMKPKHQ